MGDTLCNRATYGCLQPEGHVGECFLPADAAADVLCKQRDERDATNERLQEAVLAAKALDMWISHNCVLDEIEEQNLLTWVEYTRDIALGIKVEPCTVGYVKTCREIVNRALKSLGEPQNDNG